MPMQNRLLIPRKIKGPLKGLLLFFFLFLPFFSSHVYSQSETSVLDSIRADTNSRGKAKKHWIPFAAGAYFSDGGANYFDGYTYEILRANVNAGNLGFPIHNDWNLYSPFSTSPTFSDFGAYFHLADTNLNLRLRFAGSWMERSDSMHYQGSFAVNDTVSIRIGTERSRMAGLGVTVMRTTRNYGRFFRLYAGGMFEMYGTTRTAITYKECNYDLSEQRIVEQIPYTFRGKPRLNIYGSAVIGAEFTFFQRIGLTAEVRSGIGPQFKAGEKTLGIAKTAFMLGAHAYLVPNRGNRPRAKAPEILQSNFEEKKERE